MASDSNEPSRRKHHRSSPSDEDTGEPLKRRKHRHHHRHHRHHRHHSKKHLEKSDSKSEKEMVKSKSEIENGGKPGEEMKIGTVVGVSTLGIDYDMEEGEIIEDDVVDTAAVGDADEITVTEKLGHEDDLNMELHEAQEQGPADNVEKVDRDSTVSVRHDEQRKSRKADRSRERKSSDKHSANGSYIDKFHKLDSKPQKEDSIAGEESTKQKSYDEDENEVQDRIIKSSTPENVGKRHRSVRVSSSHYEHPEERHVTKSSKSPDRSRGRSRSKSVLEESFLVPKSREIDDTYEKESRYRGNFDDEKIGYNRDYRHGSRDSSRDREKEHNSGNSRSSRDRYYNRESVDRFRESSMENDRDRVREKDRERELAREKLRESDKERRRESDKERERVRERDREREREKARDRERDREREHERGRGREREREREREERERRNRDRESRGRSREADRDRNSDRYSRQQDDSVAYNRRNRHYETDIERGRTSNHLKTETTKQHAVETESERSRRDEVEQEDYQEKVVFQLAEQDEEDELDRIKEESRRRRQAILEKYKIKNSQKEQVTQSGDVVEIHMDQSTQKPAIRQNVVQESIDAKSNGADVEPTFSVGKSPLQGGQIGDVLASGAGGLGQGTPKSERSADMFCDDIFGESPAGIRKMGKGDGVAVERSGLHDNWDDPEGYYSYRFGEILDGRYEIVAAHGKGVFSTVVRAKDLKARPGDPEEVAIKMIRNNETMYKAGMEELVILKKLVGADPEDKRHCVRFISSFKYRNHLCLVFESLHMNLREVLKKFGRNIGLKLTAVRTYAKQLFIALKHLKNCGVLHCDIKPDNMLVNEAKNVLKLCDFGNAMFAGKNEITPYLVSRFYRAPEIILGLSYDHPMDIWSVGCCLFELYAGKVLFPGPSNNDMLRLHMELKGPFPKKMLRKGAFTEQHFDQDLNFLAIEEDPVTKKAIRKLIVNIKPKDISAIISGSPGEDPKMLAHFKDLMERIFVLDPEKRMTVSQALSHPFITGK
ncbi:serine/threonine-protein kinase prpf4B isoform X2 [Solanum pennellii]|uniref:non-specific serine/threonine protein kinase n=1 Tax=Solanum pennellii TaxID=28526 RepID=A0ABM1GU98_SOLPN|nr:serine/threonine-protein kinase prpf4B isoform X2 [Solanum pennellii]